MGEALDSLRKADPETPERVTDVKRIIGMRNVLVHGDAVVDDSVVVDAASSRLAGLPARAIVGLASCTRV